MCYLSHCKFKALFEDVWKTEIGLVLPSKRLQVQTPTVACKSLSSEVTTIEECASNHKKLCMRERDDKNLSAIFVYADKYLYRYFEV